jgi:hypothetical protein
LSGTPQTLPRQLSFSLPTTSDPETLFARVFRRLGLRRPEPHFRIAFRPFAGVRSSIHLRDGKAKVEISDVLADAPPLVLEALAEILLAQVFRKRPSREARECYLAHIFKPHVRDRIDEARRARGRKRLLPARGEHCDLEAIFAKLNRRYFRGELRGVRIGWSPHRSRTVLGHYDAAHRTISISRRLDSARAPRFLAEYLVYHEMLHARFPVERNGARRVVHTREFLEAERKFPRYEEARRRLKLSCP